MTLLTRTRRDSQRWPEETQAHSIFFEENFLFLNFFILKNYVSRAREKCEKNNSISRKKGIF